MGEGQEERRLPGSIRADERENLSASYLEGWDIQEWDTSPLDLKISGLQDRRRVRRVSSVSH